MKLKSIKPSSSLRIQISAHRLAISITAVVVLLISGYALWSKHIWDEYETRSNQWHDARRAQITATLALPVTNEKERTNKFAALKQESDAINDSKDSICNVNYLVGWQRTLEMFGAREKKCQAAVSDLVVFNGKMRAATVYLENEQALAMIINSIPYKAELVESDWEAQGVAWHDASAKIENLSGGADFAPTKQIAHEATKKLDAAWQEVIDAHKAKDKTQYTAAQSELAAAYGSLDDIASISVQQLKAVLDPLQTAYEKAFKLE